MLVAHSRYLLLLLDCMSAGEGCKTSVLLTEPHDPTKNVSKVFKKLQDIYNCDWCYMGFVRLRLRQHKLLLR